MKRILVIAGIIAVAGCGDGGSGSNSVAPVDTEKPYVEILCPTADSYVYPGQLKIMASAEDNEGVRFVRFQCGKAVDFVDADPPYMYYADIPDTGAGSYSQNAVFSICATAVDFTFNYRTHCINVIARH